MEFSPFPPRPRDQKGIGSWGRDGVGFNKGFFIFYAQFVRKHADEFPRAARVRFFVDEKRKVAGFQFAPDDIEKRDTYAVAPSKSRIQLSTRTVNAPRFTRVLREFGYKERENMIPTLQKGIWILPKPGASS